MSENMKTPKTLRIVNTAWIFDVDGVITNPSKKQVKETQILDYIFEQLKKDKPIILNTGRSLTWIIDRVINPLIEKAKDKIIFKNLFAVGEKGGTWLTIDENGIIKQNEDKSINVPQALKSQVRKLINIEYPNSMFYDESKLTMISTEMKDDLAIENYKEKQIELNEKLQQILEKDGLEKILKVDPSTIATDIQNKKVGKGFAIKRIMEWLRNNKLKPEKFLTFGDSINDVSMAEKLKEMNLPVEFVFVGDKKHWMEKLIHLK